MFNVRRKRFGKWAEKRLNDIITEVGNTSFKWFTNNIHTQLYCHPDYKKLTYKRYSNVNKSFLKKRPTSRNVSKTPSRLHTPEFSNIEERRTHSITSSSRNQSRTPECSEGPENL